MAEQPKPDDEGMTSCLAWCLTTAPAACLARAPGDGKRQPSLSKRLDGGKCKTKKRQPDKRQTANANGETANGYGKLTRLT